MYKCPCCQNYTLGEKPPGTFEICNICNWEDDNVQYYDLEFKGGANDSSLKEAKKLWNNGRKFINKERAKKLEYGEIKHE